MRFAIVMAVGALAFAGAAAAQLESVGKHWTSPEIWDGFNHTLYPSDPDLPGLPAADPRFKRPAADALRTAVPQMRAACAVDRQSLCADKSSNLAADRCLEYNRLKVSQPCREAWDKVQMAAEGRM
ncbi:hypothetical protein [Phenylobacterium sp.]|jgi:hypothetical protein|uniref:hypothetical protein n=1 Tax=Phenylobacterium sp. TaxID=1871053 RepID=UPI00122011CD|nr:hypothetical protein [Phenylobacterium sp.]THD55699.1 MAG: hypothetical protein E8A12_15780 [Phenylobacterium sp.]